MCSPECVALHGQLERLNSKLIANQTSPDLPMGIHEKFSNIQLDRTVYISVLTLIMQGLCDAISKRGKVQMIHWGRLPLPPCAAMHVCCCTSEARMKAGIHAVYEASRHLKWTR